MLRFDRRQLNLKIYQTQAHEASGDFDEGVNGLEFITDTIKTLLRGENYQSKFAQLIAPVGPNDAALQQLLLPTAIINRSNEISIINILEQRETFETQQARQKADPIERAKIGATNPIMNIFRAFGSGPAAAPGL